MIGLALHGCRPMGRAAVRILDPVYAPEGETSTLAPTWTGADAHRSRIPISLTRVAEARQPTDIAFVEDLLFVTEKAGRLRWFDSAGATGTWLELEVLTVSEQGLLGIAFHPRFERNGRFFLNVTVREGGRDVSQVVAYRVDPDTALRTAAPERVRVVMEVEQPYQNHNGGQVAFGPDGMLYVGWGDGGLRADPDQNGQDGGTWLGSMLRIDVDGGTPYAVPPDNPHRPGWKPEVWAIGLRNPWRYTFAPDGRLVVADVGQDAWEEVSLVEAGDNLGWPIQEAEHCFAPKEGCDESGLVQPVWSYGRDDGQSITGGHVYTGSRIGALRGRYLAADFVSGRIWALRLPARGRPADTDVAALGKWPILPAAFGRDAHGELYAADFAGAIYRIDPP